MIKRVGVLALLCASCAPDNDLSGSIGELFPLDVSKVLVFRNQEAMKVQYLANRGINLDVVIELSMSLDGVDPKDGAKIDLSGEYSPGHQRTEVEHAPGGEPTRILPNVKKGDMHIDHLGIGPICNYDAGLPDGGIPCSPPDTSSGNFSILFAEDGSGDIGSGRTLVGTFHTNTIDAGYGPF
jgi:hypothetical protein